MTVMNWDQDVIEVAEGLENSQQRVIVPRAN